MSCVAAVKLHPSSLGKPSTTLQKSVTQIIKRCRLTGRLIPVLGYARRFRVPILGVWLSSLWTTAALGSPVARQWTHKTAKWSFNLGMKASSTRRAQKRNCTRHALQEQDVWMKTSTIFLEQTAQWCKIIYKNSSKLRKLQTDTQTISSMSVQVTYIQLNLRSRNLIWIQIKNLFHTLYKTHYALQKQTALFK